jgi:hypothetical protein
VLSQATDLCQCFARLEEVEALEAAKRELAEVVRRSQVTRARD